MGLFHLIRKNMTAKTLKFPVREWHGKSFENIVYSDVSENTALNLYLPDSGKKCPLLILVHGGGFMFNDCNSRQPKLMYEYFRENGYACASINYRLTDEAKYPAAVEDVKAAVRFLYGHADEYGYDGEKIAIWGESAGGYLALMAAFDMEEISAVVDFYGIVEMQKVKADFEAMKVPLWFVNMANGAWSPDKIHNAFLGQSVESLSEQKLAEIDPHTRIGAGLAKRGLHVYLTHGSADITVAEAQTARLYRALLPVLGGGRVVYNLMPDFKHADDRFYTDGNLLPVKEFLDRVFEK